MNISTFNISLQFLRNRTELKVENENGTRKHTRKQNKKERGGNAGSRNEKEEESRTPKKIRHVKKQAVVSQS